MLGGCWQSFQPSVLAGSVSSVLAKQLVESEASMSKAKDDIRPEYRREELGRGVRGKYLARVSRGTNLVVLEDKVAKAFPDSDSVNQALLGKSMLTSRTCTLRRWNLIHGSARFTTICCGTRD